MPILLSFKKDFNSALSRVYFDIGTRFSALLGDSYEISVTSNMPELNIEDEGSDEDLNPVTAGIILALGMEFNNRWVIELKGDVGVTNLYKTVESEDDDSNMKSTTSLIGVGFKF